MLSEAEALDLLRSCSNRGRWGANDELGTLNLITPEKRRAALASVRSGEAVSLGRDLLTQGSRQTPPSAVHVMTSLGPDEISLQDLLLVSPHGFETTHLDAVGHAIFEGIVYGGQPVSDAFSPTGLRYGAITAMRDGVVTRGVLIDVAASRGVEHLEQGAGIGAADLDRAERAAGVRVEPGDAIVVRSGLGVRLARGGEDTTMLREGLLADAVAWLHARDVALYAGDCIERLPSGYPRLPMPLHQIGLAAMGLCILDAPDVEALAAACATRARHEFVLLVAPLRIPGGTASPVNPLAIF